MAAVSWKNPVTANWTTGSDWSSGTPPLPADDVTIGVAGSYTVSVTTAISVNSITLSDVNALLAITAPGLTDAVAKNFANSGYVYVDQSGTGGTTLTIGGTLTNQGTLVIGNSGITKATTVTAAAVTNSNVLAIQSGSAAAALKVTGGFNNTGTLEVDYLGTGGGSLTIGGTLTNSGNLYIGGTGLTKATTVRAASLANTGTIYMNEGTGAAATATLYITGAAPTTLSGTYSLAGNALIEFGSGGVTAIGSGATVTLNGPKALLALASAPTTDSALTGLASNAGQLILLDAPALTTTVGLDNSYNLYIDQSGTGGSNLRIGGTLTNSGTLQIGNTAITAATTLSAAALSNFGKVYLYSGTAAATLKVTGGFGNTGNMQVDYGGTGGSSLTIGGTLTNSGNLYIGGTGLTKATTVTAASLANTGTIYMNEGAGPAATATLNITGAAPTTLSGTYTLAGNALIEFGSGGVSAIGNGATVTLNGPKALLALASTPTTDSALSKLSSNAGQLILLDSPALTTTVGLDNSYYLYVDQSGLGGSNLTIGGALTNEYILDIGNTSLSLATTVGAAALSNFGSFSLYSGTGAAATLKVTGAFSNSRSSNAYVDQAGPGGSSLTVGGTLTNNGNLYIGNTSLAIATTVKAAGLANTGTIYMNEGSIATATLNITGPAPATLSGTYTLAGNALIEFGSGGVTAIGSGATVTLNGPKALLALASAPTTDSALTGLASNAGQLILLDAPALTTTVGLDNSYYLYVDQSGLGGSSLTIGGALTNEYILDIGNTSLALATTVGAAALSNFGSLYLYSGTAAATLKVTGGFSNGRSNNAYVDNTGPGGSRLTVGGTLTNNGALYIGNTSLAKATTVTVAGLANTGTINLNGGTPATATLAVTSAATNTGTMNINAFGAINASGKTYTQSLGTTTIAATGALTAATVNVTGGILQGAGTVTGKIVNTGGSVAGGIYTSNSPGTLTVAGTYSQSGAGILQEVLTGTTAGQQSMLAVSGGANIQGGTLDTHVFFTPAAGEILPVMTFAPGTLPGLFATIQDGSFVGNGAFVNISGGLTLGALYNVAAGNIELQVLTTPATTADSWIGGAGNWTVAADWTAGVPVSDSDVTIGQTASGTVTLNTGDTINSLTITSGNTLNFAAKEALAVGADVTIRSGGTLSLTTGDGLEVGDTLSDAGKMTVGTGATVELFSNPLNVTGTLTVGGKITTAGTTAVTMGSGVDRLILNPGFSFVGLVQGGGANSTLELATGTGTGVLNAIGSEFTSFGKVIVDAGATWTVDAVASALSGVTVTGSGGANTLALTTAGTITLAGVTGFPTIKLASTGANTMSLANGNFTGVTGTPASITVYDGSAGNTVNASALTGTNRVIVHAGAGADALTGGAGSDIFYAGGKTTMTGGLGANEFVFSAPGPSNTIADFGTSTKNELVFSNSGFALGLTGATSTPQALPTGLFGTSATGTFTSVGPSAQRFAYGTTNGELFYSASGTTATEKLVATLTNHPAIAAASQLFFVS